MWIRGVAVCDSFYVPTNQVKLELFRLAHSTSALGSVTFVEPLSSEWRSPLREMHG